MSRPRGRPFEPGNKFGRGRPKGSRNRSKAPGQALLEQHEEAVARKCILRALEGDVRALRLCMERINPARRDSYVRMNLPSIATVKDVEQANAKVVKAVGAGKITPTQGQIVSGILDSRRRVIETVELQQRIEKLEQDAAAKNMRYT